MPTPSSRNRTNLTRALKQEAERLGFLACGVSAATHLAEEENRLASWLQSGFQGSMTWMERNREKRLDPRELVPGARSVISVLDNYFRPEKSSPDTRTGRISRYAWGDDYHDTIKSRLRELYSWLEERTDSLDGRVFVDSAPVLDKAWAARSGLGWIGKHSNLINPAFGSWFFIGEMIVSVDLDTDAPIAEHCGSCTKCIDACPTDAITQPFVVDGSRCISYLTIEHRDDDIRSELKEGMGNWIYGCDICQDVCPWNKFATDSGNDSYAPRPGTLDTDLDTWVMLSEEEFQARFRKSPIKRAKWAGFKRNVRIALENAAILRPGERESDPKE